MGATTTNSVPTLVGVERTPPTTDVTGTVGPIGTALVCDRSPLTGLSPMFSHIREDVAAMAARDPAAKGYLSILLTYPGLHAVWGYRLAHALWTRDHQLTALLCSQLVRALTGVEIHPGAEIGRRVTIDHGMGVVIGETAVVGDDVHCYHGVTLGGNVNEPVKRHPTVERGAHLGANATLLGDITVGENAVVGAGSVVVEDVPAGVRVAGVPAREIG